MPLIPREAQETLANLFHYLDPARQGLRIYQQGELVYGQRPQNFVNRLGEEDLWGLLEAFDNPKGSPWEINVGETPVLAGDRQFSEFGLAASPKSLGLALRRGQVSLGQALCGYWQLEGIKSEAPPPAAISLVEAIQAMPARPPLTSAPITVPSEKAFLMRLPLIEGTSIEALPTAIAPPTPQLSIDSLTLKRQEFVNQFFQFLAAKNLLKLKEGKGIFTFKGETLIARFNQDNQWEYESGTLAEKDLLTLEKLLKNQPKSARNIDLQL